MAVVIIFAIIVIGALIVTLLIMKKEHAAILTAILEQHSQMAIEWNKERQLLLDRIQAPTFSEMKQAEVKKIRAENGEQPPQPIIPL